MITKDDGARRSGVSDPGMIVRKPQTERPPNSPG
jgi:hypothetical protein